MGGLARICKMYGSMEVSDKNGKKVTWLWDYKNDKPRLKSEMTKEEIFGFLKEQYCVGNKKAQIAYEIACREKALLDQLEDLV